MKKTFISLAAMFFTFIAASAQTFDREVVDKADADKTAMQNIVSATSDEDESIEYERKNETTFGYEGAEKPVGYHGFPNVADASASAAQLTQPEFLSKLNGYKLVGLRFAVTASLGKKPSVFATVWNKEDVDGKYLSFNLSPSEYAVSTITEDENGKHINLVWNDIYFHESVDLTEDLDMIRYGYFYIQNTDANSIDSTPILFGKTTDCNNGLSWMVYGTFVKKMNWYTIATDSKPYTPCVLLLCKSPNDETVIVGVDGVKKLGATKVFTVNGTQIDAPRKGINVIRTENGATRKVLIKR